MIRAPQDESVAAPAHARTSSGWRLIREVPTGSFCWLPGLSAQSSDAQSGAVGERIQRRLVTGLAALALFAAPAVAAAEAEPDAAAAAAQAASAVLACVFGVAA